MLKIILRKREKSKQQNREYETQDISGTDVALIRHREMREVKVSPKFRQKRWYFAEDNESADDDTEEAFVEENNSNHDKAPFFADRPVKNEILTDEDEPKKDTFNTEA